MHDHPGKGTTTNGIYIPRGNMTAIAPYENYMDENGRPITKGEDLGMFFLSGFLSPRIDGRARRVELIF